MPIKIPDSLPATAVLESENIFVMTEYRAMHQDIRPLNVLILNLMPTKVVTENQLLRKLSNTPLQIKVEFLQTASYTPQHVDTQHMESFYTTFEQVKDRWFDGLIITGAPLAFVPYEKVHYWKELCTIMDWAKTHVHSTMHICWGALAGLYYHFGIPTVEYPEKLSGVYPNTVLKQSSPLFRGFDDVFLAPHSREVGILKKDVDKVANLWLEANLTAHDFISEKYWKDHFNMVKEQLLQAEVYIYEDCQNISGFIGITDEYVEGIFVSEKMRSQGIGKQLLDFVKDKKSKLYLNVYQKNIRAVQFYQREDFEIDCESIDEDTRERDYEMIWKEI